MKDPHRPSHTPLRAVSVWKLCVVLLLIPSLVLAPPLPPAWWAGRGATDANPADDFAAANVGQLKHFAAKAVAELEGWLPGGAGATLTGMVANWNALAQQQTPPGPAPGDYSAVNVGQLKYVAKPIYDRLMAEGYATGYPWTAATTDDVDSAMANLGQLKRVFYFGPTVDTDGDGLPDWWENKHRVATGLDAGNPNDAGQVAPGGMTFLEKFLRGLNPAVADSDGDTAVDGEDRYPHDSRRSEDIPARSYAVLDLSQNIPANVKATFEPDYIALDDSQNVAFFGSSNATTGSGKTGYVYRWQNGVLTLATRHANRPSSNLGTLGRPRRRRDPQTSQRPDRIGGRRCLASAQPTGDRLLDPSVVGRGSLCAPQEAIASPLASGQSCRTLSAPS